MIASIPTGTLRLYDGVTMLQRNGHAKRRLAAEVSATDEESFFVDTVLEYQWARDVAGLASSTLDKLLKPVIEVCDYYGVVPWRLTSRELDKYFAGPGRRAQATVRQKLNRIDGYFAFLEQRYGGEIARRFGGAVKSPIDPFNRPRHRGSPDTAAAIREGERGGRAQPGGGGDESPG